MLPLHSVSQARLNAEAIVALGVTVALTLALRQQLAETRLLLFWVMSVFVAWRSGLWPVIGTSVIGAALFVLVVQADVEAYGTVSPPELFTLAIYVVVSAVLGVAFDSLRRKRAQVAEATNGMLDAMMVLDPHGRLQFFNEAARTLGVSMGLDLKALRKRVLWEAVPALAGTEFELEPLRALSEQRAIDFQARFPGANAWVRVRAAPTSEGGVTLFAHDVTGKMEAERERMRTDQRYRALVEASTVMVWNTDVDGTVDVPAWHEITGQTTAEQQSAGWLQAIHSDDRAKVVARWNEARERQEAYEIEYRLRQREGAYRWYRVRAVPIREGDLAREWVGVLDDVHEERVARERHEAVENALAVLGVSLDYEWNFAAVTRLLVPTLADYCSVDLVDVSGDIRRVSSTHRDPEKEVLLRALWNKFPYRAGDPGAPEVVRTGVAQLNPRIQSAEITRFARTEEQAEMLDALAPRSYLCVPMRSSGQVFGALSLVYSDSGREHTAADQAAVEQIAARAATAIENARLYAEAQAASRAKSDFLATMSHELRTPLNAIAGYADLLALGVRGPVTEDQLRDLGRIRQNQQHLLEIITDILNFSRLEAGHTRYLMADFPVTEVLERMEGVIEPQARARSIEYHYVAPAADLVVNADREKLEQVLINLLGNAMKFTPAGGSVSVSAVGVDTRVRIMVRDTGVGIPAGELASIFEPFVQLEPALTRTIEGTGLGLAISRELTRGMGGELRAESAPGKGSTFYVELARAGGQP